LSESVNLPLPARDDSMASTADTAGLLEVRNLRVTLSSGIPAVDGVSFEIGRGECVALVGESGCGKSLTALSLVRAVPPEVGETAAEMILLGDRRVDRLDRGGLRRVRGGRVGMIFQEPSACLDPLFTVGSQIVETIRAHQPVSRPQARKRALAALEEAGLSESGRVFDSYPHQLSGGQCQRAFIALALATDPELLVADEPTTALDVTVQRRILDLLAELRRRRGLSLLLITHNLAVVARLADRVLMMYAGQVVEQAPAGELFSTPAHPYTQALLECLPDVDHPRPEPPTIPGVVPQPGNWPAGCRFRPRCRLAEEACAQEQMLERTGRRLVRCWKAVQSSASGEGR